MSNYFGNESTLQSNTIKGLMYFSDLDVVDFAAKDCPA
jgi:hypothetical protein